VPLHIQLKKDFHGFGTVSFASQLPFQIQRAGQIYRSLRDEGELHFSFELNFLYHRNQHG